MDRVRVTARESLGYWPSLSSVSLVVNSWLRALTKHYIHYFIHNNPLQ